MSKGTGGGKESKQAEKLLNAIKWAQRQLVNLDREGRSIFLLILL